MKIVNLTPHCVTIFRDESENTGSVRSIPPFGHTVRLESETQQPIHFDDLQVDVVTAPTFKNEIQWPDIPDDTDVVLVSMPVGQQVANNGEKFLFYVMGPDTGPESVVRDSVGQILGVKRLVLYAERK